MNNLEQYLLQLLEPSWNPPAWLFVPVWVGLFIMIVISFGKVFLMAWKKEISPKIALPFGLNLIFNLAIFLLHFWLGYNLLAALAAIFLIGTLVWAMAVIWSPVRWVAYMQIPYLLWVFCVAIL